MYDALLAQAGPGAGVGAPPPPAPPPPSPGAAMGVGLGDPPKMPGMPPAPTGTGGIPTGDPSTNKKEAADNAVLALRELKGHYPSLGAQLDPLIDQIKSAAKGKSAPAGGLGAPSAPGTPPPEVPPTSLSGTTGAA